MYTKSLQSYPNPVYIGLLAHFWYIFPLKNAQSYENFPTGTNEKCCFLCSFL